MSTHHCPAPGCPRQVQRDQYACRGHWFALPKELRDAIWAGYRSGDTAAHVEAMADAQRYLDERYGGEPAPVG